MEFKTKFKIGDKVFTMSSNSVVEDTICAINIFTKSEFDNRRYLSIPSIQVEYLFTRGYGDVTFPYEYNNPQYYIRSEKLVFSTKEELLKSL